MIIVAATIGIISITILPTLIFASSNDFLNFEKVFIINHTSKDNFSLWAMTDEFIPKGPGFAHGFGILTFDDNKMSTLVITSTHSGILDSKKQTGNTASDIWHNHYVDLVSGEYSLNCHGHDYEVASMSFESPGQVDVYYNRILLFQAPDSTPELTEFFSGETQEFTLGQLGDGQAVSFTLVPINLNTENGDVDALCVDLYNDENNPFNAELITIEN